MEGDGCTRKDVAVFEHFYPRPPGGGRQATIEQFGVEFGISIHALRVEGDERSRATRAAADHISIHALRVEGDPVTVNQRHGIIISIHALRVEGDANYYEYSPEELISIHALRVEGDTRIFCAATVLF